MTGYLHEHRRYSRCAKGDRDRGGYREPPELAKGGNKGSSSTEGTHRKTGREAERPPRSSSGGPPGSLAPRPKTSNQITAPRRSTRALKRVKRQEAAKQQTAKGSNWPEPQGNSQGTLSLQETKRERHVRGQSQACCIAAGMFTIKRLRLSGLSGTSSTPRKGWPGETRNPTLVLQRILVKHD